jgi:ketosteroid isomerase-like protein
MAANYADDAVMMLDRGPVLEGAAAIKQGFTDFVSEDSIPNVTLATHDIMLLPSTAIERGTFQLTRHRKGSTGADFTMRGKYMTVWQQQEDGSWKIVRDISNSDP